MNQFKSLLDNFVARLKNDLADQEINPTRETLLGLLIQYVENLIDNTGDQERYEKGLYQKTTNYKVENTELLIKRTLEIGAISALLYEEFNNE